MCGNPQNPLSMGMSMFGGAGNLVESLKAGIDLAYYFEQKEQEFQRSQRYDDNQKHMVVNALRMYEKGELSKDQLKAIIDVLPGNASTQTVEVKPQRQELIPQQRRSEFDLGALLGQFTYN